MLAAVAVVSSYQLVRVPPRAEADSIGFQQIASGLSSPVGIVSAGDSRLFIVEQPGRIRIYDGTTVLTTSFLDVSSLVSCCTERGLLGLAFHPNYATNGLFFVYYTNTSGNIVIARYHVSSDPNVADPNSGLILLTIPHPGQANHNGGSLAFGPDGKLYAGIGDGGGAGDTSNNAQNLGVLLGKVLRLDVDIAAPYVPSDNPFVHTTGARGEIWAYGVRNPWRLSFDRMTGDLFIGDVGQDAWEEVDFQPAGSSGGQNYGWHLMEGTHCYNPPTNCNPGGLTLPILEYPHGTGDCSITGAYRYRGSQPGAVGTYIYGDYCSGRIWGARLTGGVWSSTPLADTTMTVTSFGQDNAGELYVTDYSRGTISRIAFPDSDGDGCIDAREAGADHRTGGQRDAASQWDFFDVPAPALLPSSTSGARNRAITIGDTIAVLAYVGTSAANPNAANANGATYGSDLNGNGVQDGQEYDRTTGASPWAPAGPNGAVSISDVVLTLNSVGDNCN